MSARAVDRIIADSQAEVRLTRDLLERTGKIAIPASSAMQSTLLVIERDPMMSGEVRSVGVDLGLRVVAVDTVVRALEVLADPKSCVVGAVVGAVRPAGPPTAIVAALAAQKIPTCVLVDPADGPASSAAVDGDEFVSRDAPDVTSRISSFIEENLR